MRVINIITRLIVGGAQENTVASVLGLRKRPGFDVQPRLRVAKVPWEPSSAVVLADLGWSNELQQF